MKTPAREPMTKHRLLDLAKQATADRGASYGSPEENFDRITLRWRAHIKNRFGLDVAIDATSVAIMCADLKLARLEHEAGHLDSWVDGAGYMACGAECNSASQFDPESVFKFDPSLKSELSIRSITSAAC